MPTPSDIFAVERAIISAISWHQAHPFQILRERGAVADLRGRIMEEQSLRGPVSAVPSTRMSSSYAYAGVSLEVLRTQLEISVSCDLSGYKKALDLAILKPSPTLDVRQNGPGDVLQQFRIEDVDIAIEVKTSQSCDAAARGSYIQDIYALLLLRQRSLELHPRDPAHGYFILVDRNDPVYGSWRERPKARMIWETNIRQEFVLRKKGCRPKRILGGLSECGLQVSAEPPPHQTWIKCFVLNSTGTTEKPLYAYMIHGAPVSTVSPYISQSALSAEASKLEVVKDGQTLGGLSVPADGAAQSMRCMSAN